VKSRIAELNDALRTTFAGGKILMTRGVAALLEGERAAVLNAVRTFDAFTADNNPHGERDFGKVEVGGLEFFWKIDYFAPDMEYGSENPADPKQTVRVLTIMFAEEY
jgi:Protein of unknown function (DUF3768)